MNITYAQMPLAPRYAVGLYVLIDGVRRGCILRSRGQYKHAQYSVLVDNTLMTEGIVCKRLRDAKQIAINGVATSTTRRTEAWRALIRGE